MNMLKKVAIFHFTESFAIARLYLVSGRSGFGAYSYDGLVI